MTLYNPIKLYKYVSAETAMKIFENKKFKFSSPLHFNDIFDTNMTDILPENHDEFFNKVQELFVKETLLGTGELDGIHPLMPIVTKAFNEMNEEGKNEVSRELLKYPYQLTERANKLQKETQEIMQKTFSRYGIFCCSSKYNNAVMWGTYADKHKGAVIEVTPCIERDSVFLLAKPVEYVFKRPNFYENPEEFISFAKLESHKVAEILLNRFIFTKSYEWKYENEYRLAIPELVFNENEFSLESFNPLDITGVYLGCRMTTLTQSRISKLACNLNPGIKILKAEESRNQYDLIFKPLN